MRSGEREGDSLLLLLNGFSEDVSSHLTFEGIPIDESQQKLLFTKQLRPSLLFTGEGKR